jgi:phosphatidylserine decarboxylase
MRVAPEGWPFIAIAWIIVAVLAWFRLWPALLLWLPIAIWVIAFFRDPVRSGPRGDDLILAPADGKVVSVIPIDEPAFVRGQTTRVSIFMNVFDVHVNRIPASGRVTGLAYRPGKFFNASLDKASEHNERQSIRIATPQGPTIGVVQIAGLVARRIKCDLHEDQPVEIGDRFGLIRFGSRLDVYLPAGVSILAIVGQRAIAGETVIADFEASETMRTGKTR